MNTGLMERSRPERPAHSRPNTNRLPVAPRPTLISWLKVATLPQNYLVFQSVNIADNSLFHEDLDNQLFFKKASRNLAEVSAA